MNACSYKLQYFHDFFPVENAQQVADFVTKHRHDQQMTAFWLWDGDLAAMALFINGEAATLYHDASMGMSWNGQEVDEHETMEFMLENGQVDEYPVAYSIEVEPAIQAFAECADKGQRSQSVHWVE